MLTEADLSSGTFEVQRLRFALPKGGHAFGPSAHIKVRAPDAPGQRDRVRAYSALLEESAAGVAAEAAWGGRSTFNLTVKIYPGGPPSSRGTSAYLGSVPVGEKVHVPQTRTMAWAVGEMHQVRRVGLVAFGVGIVECLEPAELLLGAGAEVCGAKGPLAHANHAGLWP